MSAIHKGRLHNAISRFSASPASFLSQGSFVDARVCFYTRELGSQGRKDFQCSNFYSLHGKLPYPN